MDSSDYIVEQYIKPACKRDTYDKTDDHYISEQDEVSEESGLEEISEEEIDDSEYKKVNGEKSEVPKEQKDVNKKKPQAQKDKPQPTEAVRTTSRLILHVSNLSEETTKEMLEAYFRDAGILKSVRIPKKRGSNNFAFVEMLDPSGYKNGLEFNGRELDEKIIQVQPGSKNKKHKGKSKPKRKAPNNDQNEKNFKKKRF